MVIGEDLSRLWFDQSGRGTGGQGVPGVQLLLHQVVIVLMADLYAAMGLYAAHIWRVHE